MRKQPSKRVRKQAGDAPIASSVLRVDASAGSLVPPNAEDWFELLEIPGADKLNKRDVTDLRRILGKVTVTELGGCAEIISDELSHEAGDRKALGIIACYDMWLAVEQRREKVRSVNACCKSAAKAWNATLPATNLNIQQILTNAEDLKPRTWKQYERAHTKFAKALRRKNGGDVEARVAAKLARRQADRD